MPKRSKKKIKLCIAQINYGSENIQQHVDRLKNIVETYRSYDLIVFPELILHGHPSFERPEGFLFRKMKIIYRSVSEDLYMFVKRVKARVIIGELKRWGERYYNMATYIDKDRIQSYAKTHIHWTENFVPGKELMLFDSPFGKIGITICFDSAFSEVWRVLALQGADIIVNISAVPKEFPAEYMKRRLVGAAMFNQVFVVYANRPGRFFSGNSAVFGPTGDVLARAGVKEAMIESEIDLSEIQKWRVEEEIYANRQPLLYREIVSRHKLDARVSDKGMRAGGRLVLAR